MIRRSILAFACLALSSCIDGTGPRPRPGTTTNEPPPEERAQLLWFETVPRVIVQGRSDSIVVNVGVTGNVDGVFLQPRTGNQLALTRTSDGVYTIRIHPSLLLFGYRTGDLRHLAGFLEVTGEGLPQQEFLHVNVKDVTIPSVSFNSLPGQAQASAHILNLRVDALTVGNEVPAAVIRTLYDHFPDDYTFIAVIEQVHSAKEPFLIPVRNDITGIGLASFDRGAQYGSGARLEAIIQYPNAIDFDLAQTDNLHEIAHRWMNYTTQPSLALGRPHWPISSAAYGILGLHNPATGEWDPFPFEIVRQSDGNHILRTADQPRSFNDLELYLMGLMPPDSVRTHFVFVNQNQRLQVRLNGLLLGAVDSVRVADIVTADGPRTPSTTNARRDFRLATIVLTKGGLMNADEMAFFDYMAARGEQRVALPFFDAINRGTTLPFYVATGGRAILTTLLRLAQPN